MVSWLFTLLALLALGAQCRSQTCNDTINIMINGNGTQELPTNNPLNLMTNLTLPITWTIRNQVVNSCTNETHCMDPLNPRMNGETFDVIVTNGTHVFLLIVTVNANAVVCRDITLGILLPTELTRTCMPTFSCSTTNTTNDDIEYTWQIQYYRSDTKWLDLSPGRFMPPASTGLVSGEGENIIAITDGGMTLSITSMTRAMVGYYRVMGNDGMVLSTFTVFLRVTFQETYRLSVNVIEGQSEIFIPCHFESFPPVQVTWQRVDGNNIEVLNSSATAKYTFVTINETLDNITDNGQHFDLTRTINGGLIIHDIVAEDHGVYECVGSNGFDVNPESVIFRVRDRLRPLWPALGIIGVFIVTGMFILAGYVVDRIREDKDRSIEPSEIDGEQKAAFRGRPSVISIDAEEENSTVQKRTHSDGYTK